MTLEYYPHSKKKDYLIVFGDKDLYHLQMKKISGRWNSKLQHEDKVGGWVVPIRNEDVLKQFCAKVQKHQKMTEIESTGKPRKEQKKYHREVSNTDEENKKAMEFYKTYSTKPEFKSPVYSQESKSDDSEEGDFPSPVISRKDKTEHSLDDKTEHSLDDRKKNRTKYNTPSSLSSCSSSSRGSYYRKKNNRRRKDKEEIKRLNKQLEKMDRMEYELKKLKKYILQ
jgi:hypothetical protein